MRIKVLFICSRNQWRSPTAEAVYRDDPRVEAQSAGLSASARRRVTAGLLRWADVVMVMEREHKRRLEDAFPELMPELHVEVLDISDDYRLMDPALVELVQERVEPLLSEALETAGGFADA